MSSKLYYVRRRSNLKEARKWRHADSAVEDTPIPAPLNKIFEALIMPQAQTPPNLDIPASQHAVEVSIIDTTSHVGKIPVKYFMQPQIPGYDMIQAPCYSFLIKHHNPSAPSKYDTLLFDLGIRKDWENGPKPVVDRIKDGGFEIKVEKNVVDILKDHGDDPAKVGGIIWSHFHWDHTGDPSTFPSTTDLIVEPGFKSRFVPGYPTNQEVPLDEGAWKDRNLREIDFETESKGLKVGSFPAIDFYGDGSFYLLSAPGHTNGHMCALARTSADPPGFIIMGGDVAHHGGEFRPTEWVPLPEHIQPNPLEKPFAKQVSACPGALFEAIHPNHSSTEPFVHIEGAIHDDPAQAQKSTHNWSEFDAQDNVFAMIAHDASLFDVVEFYPKPANEWKKKGWKEQGHWRFLRDYDTSGVKQ